MEDKMMNELLAKAGVPEVPVYEGRQVIGLIDNAEKMVERWENENGFEVDNWSAYAYINHLATVIDRLTWALNNTLVKIEELSKDEE